MKGQLKRFISFIFRIDVFDRIIVFISMVLFLILPSYILYKTDDYNTFFSTIFPCLMLIACITGTGLFTLYKPAKLSIFYFLELLVVICIYRDEFTDVSAVTIGINLSAISIIEIVYCSLGLFINVIVMVKYYLKRNKSSFKDITNGDSLYDFLNARPFNKKVEKDIENLSQTSDVQSYMPIIKRIKLSRFVRNISFLIFIACICYYFIITARTSGGLFGSELTPLLIISILVCPFLMVFTIIYPRDYKYLFYYTTSLFEILGIFCTRYLGMNQIFYIIALAANIISLLVTLITEGRTWTGGESDD